MPAWSFPALALLAVQSAPASAPAPERVTVRVDPRVELLSIVMRLAGNEEYRRGADSTYLRAVDERFGPFAQHPAVEAVRAMRRSAGISFDAPQSLAVHLDSAESLKLLAPLGPHPMRLDARWKRVDVPAFLEKLRAFAAETKFAEFMREQRPFHERAEAAYRAAAAREDFVPWLDALFGGKARATFTVVPGLLNGTNSFGVSAVLPDGSEPLYQILGVERFDASGAPVVGSGFASLLVHEAAHSYANPWVDARVAELGAAGDALFKATEKAMRAQAYGEGRTVLCESLVRAATVLYQLDRNGETAAAAELGHHESRSFFWTAELVAALKRARSALTKSRQVDFESEVAQAFRAAAAKDWSKFRPPFRGPVDAAYGPAWAPRRFSDGFLDLPPFAQKYCDEVFESIFKPKGANQVSEAVARDDAAHDRGGALVLYGTPSTNYVVEQVCDAAGWRITSDEIRLGDRVFRGQNLVLIACWASPYKSSIPAVVYAAQEPWGLVGINNIRHGGDDWLVARRSADGKFTVVDRGFFPKTLDNRWEKLR